MKTFILALLLPLIAFGADKKISELNSLGHSSFATNDLLVIVDTGAGETKNTTLGDFDFRYFLKGTDVLPIASGGTNLSSVPAAGSFIYSNGSSFLTLGSTCTAGQVLQVNGSHVWACATPATGGTVNTILVGTGMTGGGSSSTVTVGVNTELQGLSGLSSLGVIKRTGSGTYTAAAVDLTADVSGILPTSNLPQSTTSTDGYLSSTDWNTFNGKQSALTIGNLTDTGTDGITVTGGTGSVVGSGTSLSQHVSDSTHAGYLSSSDWSTFNAKQSALTFGSISTSTTGVSVGSGASSTVGPNVTVNVQTASGSQPGLLSLADWTTFNNKANSTLSNLTSPTAFNQHLLAGTDATFNIGAASGVSRPANIYASNTVAAGYYPGTSGHHVAALVDGAAPELYLYSGGSSSYAVQSSGGGIQMANVGAGVNLFNILDASATFKNSSGTVYLSGSTSGIAALSSIQINDSGSANHIKFSTPSLSGNTDYVLPATYGSSGQMLSTNGSGTLSWASGSSGATTSLNNLASTAVNSDIIPNSNDAINLGADGLVYDTVWSRKVIASNIGLDLLTVSDTGHGAGKQISIQPQPPNDSGQNGGNVVVISGQGSPGGNSGNLLLASGTGSTNSGDVTIQTGTAGATAGVIRLVEGSTASVVGYVWTATDTSGGGQWSAAGGGGANTTLSNLTSPTAINQDLNPDTGFTRTLGGSTPWEGAVLNDLTVINTTETNAYDVTIADTAQTFGFLTNVFGYLSTGQNLGDFAMVSQPNASGDTGGFIITSGNVTSGSHNSGDVVLQTGSSTGTAGSIRLIAGGTASVAGEVWMATDTNGAGKWVLPKIQVQAPAASPTCNSGLDGTLTLASSYILCVCKGGSSAWVETSDGSTACTF